MKRLLSFIAAVVFATGLMGASASAANPANFYLSGGSATVGNTVYVSISQDGDNVNAVTAKLTYDTSKLQLLNVTCAGALGNAQPESNGVTCYGAGGASTNGGGVATASFKAIATGTASVSMASNSMIVSNGSDIWTHAVNSTSVSISAAPVSTPAQGSSGSGTGSSNNKPSSASSAISPAASKTDTNKTQTKTNNSSSAQTAANSSSNNSAKKQITGPKKGHQIATKKTSSSTSTLYVLLAVLIGVIIGVAFPLTRDKFVMPKLAYNFTLRSPVVVSKKAKK